MYLLPELWLVLLERGHHSVTNTGVRKSVQLSLDPLHRDAVLSAQLIVAPVRRPGEVQNFAPEDPPCPLFDILGAGSLSNT